MNSPTVVDLFVEDRAHESFVTALLARIAREEGVAVSPRIRTARGGHGRAIAEFRLYQSLVAKGALGLGHPDLLVVAIDGNCTTFARKRAEILHATMATFASNLVVACPDPHVERWFLADPESFLGVVGTPVVIGKRKCEREYYKDALAKAIRLAGHPPSLGGIEFAEELVTAMDLYRAGKADRSFKAFLDDLRGKLRIHRPPQVPRADPDTAGR